MLEGEFDGVGGSAVHILARDARELAVPHGVLPHQPAAESQPVPRPRPLFRRSADMQFVAGSERLSQRKQPRSLVAVVV